ncbi:MAG: HDIG domain-containing protein [Synergistaceae bacterium]|nr:HDIG domain-containing protein [Synergistaceae bacterium]
MEITRENALSLFKKHNSDVKHALAVEATMRYFAEKMGGDPELWGFVGIIHDIDWESCINDASKHCNIAPQILREAGVGEDIIHAVQSHGYGACTDVKPENDMEKTLFTIDELTGLIITAGLVRPSRSLSDLEVSSVKKKWKDKTFARGVNREVIIKGAEMMGKALDELIEWTILALQPVEKEIGF